MTASTSHTPGAAPQDADWARFLTPGSGVEFVEAWFRLFCRDMPGLTRAILLLETNEGQMATAARWPQSPAAAEDPEADALRAACGAARQEGQVTLRPVNDQTRAIGLPVIVAGRAQAVLGLIAPGAMQAQTLRRAQWGIGWLHGLIAERNGADALHRADALGEAVGVLAALEDGPTLEAALRSLVNEVQPLIGADRVSVALLRRGRLRLRALSQSADVKPRTRLARGLVQAMEEARLQLHPVTYPADQPTSVTAAHRAHATRAGTVAMISVPLVVRGRLIGVLSAERMEADATPFDRATARKFEDIADLSAPLIGMKMQAHQLLAGRLPHWTARSATALFGPRHPGIKIAALALVAVVAWLALSQTTLRVTAPARIEGAVSRVAVAPFDGFVDAAPIRAGDRVQAGQVLARLDDRDLRLELTKWESEGARLEQERNAALAEADRATLAQLAARIARVEAETELARLRLDRVAIRAPLGGLVVEGDLSQQLGAPVEKGDPLFRIAGGDGHRLSLDIGEYDTRLVTPGATGTLALTGLSNRPIGIEITRLAEVATTAEGRAIIRAEARLIDPPAGLRPGLEGVAKIGAGEASRLYALWRPIIERTRVLLWTWRP
ncbi:HlyD family efflux transporter periplasmic adaptor subunit [Pseudooceanicola atlanticus]|uniref:GAF domain-containing protein n=1 Tax=Pseudooceanicola atlanticus TaxID=1461694 RepID=A0A0A0EHF0_9RHOB|nr:HlyD family efflux transporter periplasmic adaptor subunit [Pseudooceanicola atlanticus]KGM48632.1 hypothetical protein ATO9_13500 [Pseudooceanicola atlanticus]